MLDPENKLTQVEKETLNMVEKNVFNLLNTLNYRAQKILLDRLSKKLEYYPSRLFGSLPNSLLVLFDSAISHLFDFFDNLFGWILGYAVLAWVAFSIIGHWAEWLTLLGGTAIVVLFFNMIRG